MGTNPMRIKKNLPLASIFVIAIALDQALKHWSMHHFRLNQSEPFLGMKSVLLTRIANSGLIWQRYSTLFPGQVEPYIRYIPTAVILSFITGFLYFEWNRSSRLVKAGFTLFIAGGSSNLFDHWTSYFVMDTLRLNLLNHWSQPVNLADIWIAAGIAMMFSSWVAEVFSDSLAAYWKRVDQF